MRGAASLFRFAVRSHLVGAVACAIGGGVAMWIEALGFVREMETFQGGAAAFGSSIAAAAEAMRVLRWPAERLDTLGGFLTYHNVVLLPLLLGLYAAIQGAQALRGAEEKRVLDLWLATGVSRWRVALARSAAFAVALAVAAGGVAVGLLAGTALGGDAQVGASIVVAVEGSLAAGVFYALAMLLSSVFVTSGTAAGVTALAMTALYVLTNLSDRLGAFEWVRFLSPFFYRQRSDVLIPGREVDVLATAALVVMWIGLVVLGGYAFTRRDHGAALWRRAEPVTGGARATGPAWRPALWLASLLEQRVGLLAWAAGAAVFMGVYAWIVPQVQDVWDRMGFLKAFLPGGGTSALAQVNALAMEMLGPLVAAFAIWQAARWARERTDGRDDLVLAHPVTRTRLVLERLAGLVLGALVVVAGAMAGHVAGSLVVGLPIDAAALARTVADLMLLAVAVGGVGAVAVAVFGGAAVPLLTGWIVAGYLVVLFAPLFDWPAWISRLSLFDAFGRPYLGTPDVYGLTSLAALGVAGAALAIASLERRRAA